MNQQPSIHILWPTARIDCALRRVSEWTRRSLSGWALRFYFGVNTAEEKQRIFDCPERETEATIITIVTGAERAGPVWSVCQLCRQLEGTEGDIVILATDDFLPPNGWDSYIVDRIGYPQICAALLVNDGIKSKDRLVTLPIMTWSCFLKLNRLIVHPDYNWHFADAELYENLAALDLIRDVRQPNEPVFQHEHWTIGRRQRDKVDAFARKTHIRDKRTFKRRMQIPVEQRLKAEV